VQRVQQAHTGKVFDGVFGAMMDVTSVNDGPVTFLVDSDDSAAGGEATEQ
jgi:D-Tyr-tRNAtyr deacylase